MWLLLSPQFSLRITDCTVFSLDFDKLSKFVLQIFRKLTTTNKNIITHENEITKTKSEQSAKALQVHPILPNVLMLVSIQTNRQTSV